MLPELIRGLTILVVALALYTPISGTKTLFDIFTVKGGKTEGGCDDIHLLGHDITKTFQEAAEKISYAALLFDKHYANSQSIRNIAYSFFGIEMDDQMDAVKDEINQEKLKYVIGM